MNIAIRADASARIGSGHIVRCLTLAEACRKRGASIRFICRDLPGNLIDLIRARGFELGVLPPVVENTPSAGSELEWLGVSWQQDARDTHAAIASLGLAFDWLVIDQYGIDARWEQQLRSSVDRIMVIDDLADRPHDCDLLLDQNFRQTHEGRYATLVPENCTLAMGPQFALLQEDYASWRQRVSPRQSVQRVLVYFGGVDSEGLTGKAINAALSFDALAIDAVVSGSDAHLAALRQLATSQPRLTLHTGLPSLAALVATSDLAIGAFGATSWERLCLGLPTIAVSLAANQNGVATELSKSDLAVWAGSAEVATQDKFVAMIDMAMRKEDLADWSRRCMSICDGQGTSRVVDMLWTARGDGARATEGTTLGHV